MMDLKCALQVELDSLWIKPEDMARGLGIRVSNVRNWLDPTSERLPQKFAFDWLAAQSEKLVSLTDERMNDLHDSYSTFGRHFIRWYREADLPDTEPVGLHNLASRRVADRARHDGIDIEFVYACRSHQWITDNIDPDTVIDTKAEFAARTESLGVTPTEIAYALGITAASVKYWKNPKREDMLPIDESWSFLDEYSSTLDEKIALLVQKHPNPMPYHPLTRKGSLTQKEQIENHAARAAAEQIEFANGTSVEFVYI